MRKQPRTISHITESITYLYNYKQKLENKQVLHFIQHHWCNYMYICMPGAEQRFCLRRGEKCSGPLIINILLHNKKVAVNATSNMIGHITANVSINSTV